MTGTTIPSVSLSSLAFVGRDLARPECVLCTQQGEILVSDRRGGITRIHPDGRQELLGGDPRLVSNGFALLNDGTFLVANLAGEGGIWRLDPVGDLAPHLMEVEGLALAAVNFVRLDVRGRLWICANPQLVDGRYPTKTPQGVIAVADEAGARIVADNIGWTNECLVDASGRHLYVNETFGRRLTRFDLGSDARLTNRTTVTEFGHGTYPDGLALDTDGHVWVVSVASNRVIRVAPDGRQELVLEDSSPAFLDEIEIQYQQHQLTRADLTSTPGTVLFNVSSIAFGGSDLKTVLLGSIGGKTLASFRSPIAGHPPVHWTWTTRGNSRLGTLPTSHWRDSQR